MDRHRDRRGDDGDRERHRERGSGWRIHHLRYNHRTLVNPSHLPNLCYRPLIPFIAAGPQGKAWPHLDPTDWFPHPRTTWAVAKKNPEYLLCWTHLYTKRMVIQQSMSKMGLVGAIGVSLVFLSLTQVTDHFQR